MSDNNKLFFEGNGFEVDHMVITNCVFVCRENTYFITEENGETTFTLDNYLLIPKEDLRAQKILNES